MYFDIFVNGAMLVMLLIFLFLWKGNTKGLKDILDDQNYRKAVIISLWVLLTAGIAITIIFYPALDRGHDINEAVEEASRHFLDGGNPYADEVVPRFSERYHGPDTSMMNDTYNYLPGSLFFYSGAFLSLNWIGPLWFPITNLLLGLFTVLIAKRTFPKIPTTLLFALIAIPSVFFMFDNIMLTLFLFSISMYFLARSKSRYRIFMALIFLFLAVFVKALGILALAVLFLYLIQRYRLKNRHVNIQMMSFSVISICAASAMILPFGLWNVADSTVLYFSDVENRTATSGYGGTILTLILRDSPLFSLISNILMAVIVLATIFIKDPLKRIFMASSFLVLITIKASQAILVVPFYTLLTILFQEIGKKEEPSILKGGVEDQLPSK